MLLTSFLSLLSLSLPSGAAPDWPTWRGPTGDGVAAPAVTPPTTWSETSNVRWKIEIDGLGNSTPLIVGDRVYLTTAIDLGPEGDAETATPAGAQPGAPGADHLHAYVVIALSKSTGAELWRTEVVRAKPHEAQHRTASHASASLVLGEDHLVAFFGSRGLYGLDRDGALLWSQELGEMTIANQFGEGSTPVAYRDRVMVQWDEEGPSFVAAFRIRDGQELWRQKRTADSSWGSPTLAEVGDTAQVILGGSDTTVAYDVATGEVAWTLGGFSKNPTASTLVHDGVLYAMNSYRGQVIQAIRLAGASGALDGSDAVLWTAQKGAPYVPTPVAYDGLVYFLRDSKGVLNCLDAKTGEARYTGSRLGDMKSIHASPIVAAGHLYIVSREGAAAVVKAGPVFEVVAENRLDDVFDATPAFDGDAIYLRGRSALYCLANE